jgi:hypothetical protein
MARPGYVLAVATVLVAAALLPAAGAARAEYPDASAAAKACGSFRMEGLRTKVRVRVVRGGTSCRAARRVMRSLYERKRARVMGWRCVGPQTGYSQCRKGGARIEGLF